MQTMTRYAVRAIPRVVLAQLRAVDDLGRPPTQIIDGTGGSPLRCCLRSSRPGEEILLVSYAPLRRWAAARGVDPNAYDEVGPVFIHPRECEGPAGEGWPADFRAPRVLRAYDASARIIGGVLLTDDDERDSALAELAADPRVELITVRAVVFGCFTFAVEPQRA